MPPTQESSKELMLAAGVIDQEAHRLFAQARSTKDSNKRLEITNKAVAKKAEATRLRKHALQLQLVEIREASKKPSRSYLKATLVNKRELKREKS